MLQYLIIQLDNTSTSFCHYSNTKNRPLLITLDNLKNGILFAMKENLMVQYVLPDYELPAEYIEAMESIDNTKIASSQSVYANNADIVVLNGWNKEYLFDKDDVYVLRVDKKELFGKCSEIKEKIKKCRRLNIVITDVETFTDVDFELYRSVLKEFSIALEDSFAADFAAQLNVITDRMMLDKMNNCNAGCDSITLAPDGRFYVCPAFYYENEYNIGSLVDGLDIKNPQLYRLEYAPICRHCDAYQCKRCIWLNRKTTFEVNTPSHEQCVVSHLERNASRELMMSVRERVEFLSDKEEIKDISYLDPFDLRDEWL